MNLAQLPNILTITRIILTLPIVFYLLKAHYSTVLALITLAALTDGLDGWVAKRFNCQSRLGSILDPLADKTLLITSFVTLFWVGLIPDWLMFAVVVRDVMIMAGTVGYMYAAEQRSNELLMPTNLSKLNTVLQIVMVFLVVIAQLTPIEAYWITAGWVVTLTSTVLSGIDYIWLWGKHMIDLERQRMPMRKKQTDDSD